MTLKSIFPILLLHSYIYEYPYKYYYGAWQLWCIFNICHSFFKTFSLFQLHNLIIYSTNRYGWYLCLYKFPVKLIIIHKNIVFNIKLLHCLGFTIILHNQYPRHASIFLRILGVAIRNFMLKRLSGTEVENMWWFWLKLPTCMQ